MNKRNPFFVVFIEVRLKSFGLIGSTLCAILDLEKLDYFAASAVGRRRKKGFHFRVESGDEQENL